MAAKWFNSLDTNSSMYYCGKQGNNKRIIFHACILHTYIYIRYLLRFFDCLAHPNLSATFATDEKWPLCHLRISYQSLAGSLSSLQKSEFLKLIISFFHYFWCQNWDQWHKMSGKNTHIYNFFYFTTVDGTQLKFGRDTKMT